MGGLSGQAKQLDRSYKPDAKLNDVNARHDTRERRLELICYTSQVVVIFTVIIACIVNLSFCRVPSELWSSLLSLALGCMLPNPRLRCHDVKQKQLLSGPAFQFESELLSGQHNDSLHNSSIEDDRPAGRIVGVFSGGDSVRQDLVHGT